VQQYGDFMVDAFNVSFYKVRHIIDEKSQRNLE